MSKVRRDVVKLLMKKYSKENSKAYEKVLWNQVKGVKHNTKKELLYEKWSYEVIGQLLMNGADPTKVLEDIKHTRMDWNCTTLDVYKIGCKEEIDVSVLLVEGEHTCRNPKCKSTKCFVSEHQNRSGDEGMATEVTCTVCGFHYKK